MSQKTYSTVSVHKIRQKCKSQYVHFQWMSHSIGLFYSVKEVTKLNSKYVPWILSNFIFISQAQKPYLKFLVTANLFQKTYRHILMRSRITGELKWNELRSKMQSYLSLCNELWLPRPKRPERPEQRLLPVSTDRDTG